LIQFILTTNNQVKLGIYAAMQHVRYSLVSFMEMRNMKAMTSCNLLIQFVLTTNNQVKLGIYFLVCNW